MFYKQKTYRNLKTKKKNRKAYTGLSNFERYTPMEKMMYANAIKIRKHANVQYSSFAMS